MYKQEVPLLTRLFFADDPYLYEVIPITSTLITSLTPHTGPEGVSLHGQFDIVLPVKPPTDQDDCGNPARNTNSNSYIPNAPFTNQLASPDEPGERLLVSGTVYQADGVTPAAHVLLEVWQTDANGHYSQADNYAFRAQMYTDEAGHYQFTTIKPGYFQVDCQFLPAHIHYKITYADRRPLFASLYFEGDPYLAGALLITPRLIKPLEEHLSQEGPVLQTSFDLTLPAVATN
jgi:catechol 1,2-dioxygenase